jgi:DNA invertase Pin-like site-specific DNA recombinase
MKNAAVYLRSSKDRHDVSITSKKRELKKLANSKDLQIVREYVDLVESAKT